MKGLVHGLQSRVQTRFKVSFLKRDRAWFIVHISTSTLNLLSLGCGGHWFLRSKSFPTICGTPKSDKRIKSYGRPKFPEKTALGASRRLTAS